MMSRDVGDSFSDIINLIYRAFVFCFDFLNSITFFGTSLLNYFIAITILSTLFPIIFSVVRSRSGSSGGRRPRNSESDE